MTLKQEIHELIEETPDDSNSLHEIHEILRLNQALARGMDDVKNGRVYTAEEFMAKVRARWPKKSTASA